MRSALSALLVAAAVFVISTAQAEYPKLECKAEITSVTVYPDAALIVRIAEVDVSAGYTVLELKGLPLGVDFGSTVVRSKGDIAFISAEFLRERITDSAPHPDLQKSLTELDEAREKLARNEAEFGLLSGQLTYFKTLFPSGSGNVGKTEGEIADISLEACKHLLKTTEEGLTKTYDKMQANRIECAQLKKRINLLEAKSRKYGEKTSARSTVLVTVKSEKPSRASVELMTLIRDCCWLANYDSRLLMNGRVEFSYFADIVQRTGEDWNDVKITLSTSPISQHIVPPKLRKLALSLTNESEEELLEDEMESERRYAARGSRGKRRVGDPAERQFRSRQQKARARALGGGIAVEFELESRATIPCDGTIRRVAIRKFTLQNEIVYETIPRLSPNAFMCVATRNKGNYPLISGNLSVFSGNAFLGSDIFPTIASGGAFKLYFGIDPSIEVKCKPIKHIADIGKRKQEYEFEWRIEVTNHKPTPVKVLVTDALPNPENEEIKIQSVRMNPKPFENTGEKYVRWLLELEPEEQEVIVISLKISAPVDELLSFSGLWERGF